MRKIVNTSKQLRKKVMYENGSQQREIPVGHYHFFSYDTSMEPQWMDDNYIDYTDFEPAKLHSHELLFNIVGPNQAALPNICRSEKENKCVHGILYTLSSPQDGVLKIEDSLRRLKGRVFIEDINVEVLGNGKIKPAFIFVASMDETNNHLSRIEQTYFNEFITACRYLPKDYVDELRSYLKLKFVMIQYKQVKNSGSNSRLPPEPTGSRPKYLKQGFFKFF